MLTTANYKGTRDFYPEELKKRSFIFNTWRSVISSSGFEEYDTSVLENKEIYTAKSGEELADSQLYWFTDKGDRQVALRPEETPSLARIVAARMGELALPIRWFSIPNCFRYERPQKGRLREFWQLNVDIVGSDSWASDAELLTLVYRLFQAFKAPEGSYSIRLNNREVLDQWIAIQGWADKKDQIYKVLDSWHKLETEKKTTWLTELGVSYNFDALADSSSVEYQEYLDLLLQNPSFSATWKVLQTISPNSFTIDPSIVRGIAYYTGTVFEAYDTHPENQRALFGGGRYDNLLELFGKSAPAVGFGWGDVTMHEFLLNHNLYPELDQRDGVGILVLTPESLTSALTRQSELSSQGIHTILDTSFDRATNKRENSLLKKVTTIESF